MSKRLLRELGLLRTELPPYIHAVPREDDIHKIDVIFAYMPHDDTKPRAAPYAHGVYWFALTIPGDYPYGGFTFFARTPSGRFTADGNVCLSETRFHSREANTAVSITGFLTSAALYMTTEDTGSIGYTKATDAGRWDYATGSMKWNLGHTEFRRAFPDLTEDMELNQAVLISLAPVATKRAAEPSGVIDPPAKKTRLEPGVPSHAPNDMISFGTINLLRDPVLPPKKRRRGPVAPKPVATGASTPDDILTSHGARAVTWTDVTADRKCHKTLAGLELQHDFVSAVMDFALIPKTPRALNEWVRRVNQVHYSLDCAADKIKNHTRNAILEYNVPPMVPVPDGALQQLAIPLLPHQEEVFGIVLDLDSRGGGFLGDSPGLGKTVVMAAVACIRKGKKTLIIVTSKLKTQWHTEMVRMGVPTALFKIITRNTPFEPGDFDRIIVDEAHQARQISSPLRSRLEEFCNSQGAALWFISGTPDVECMSLLRMGYQGADKYSLWMDRAIVRARSDVALDLPSMYEWTVTLDLPPNQRVLYDRIAETLRVAIGRDQQFGHRSWHRFKVVLGKLVRALATGRFDDILREVQAYEVLSTDEENSARALRLNRPGPGARVGDWLMLAGRNSPECPICLGALTPDETVFYLNCRHTTCAKCFDANMKNSGAPHCGLPCGRTTYGECYLLSALQKLVGEEPDEELPVEVPMTTGPVSSAKIDRMMQIVRAAGLAQQRVAIASHDMELIHEMGKMLDHPTKLTQTTAGSSVGGILDRITSGKAPVLLIHTQCANAGLNLQHYHHVVLMDESLDPTEERQLLARFCRMGTTVDRILVHHLVTTNTVEQRLAERRAAEAPRPHEFIELL